MKTILAAAVISGDNFLSNMAALLVYIMCAAILWALGRWLFAIGKLPPLVLTVWTAIFVVVGALALINFLLGLVGHGFHAW